uniref:Uncharacterized protein n=1 Tax=Parascaris equorum TaxID=6256 RepID=A0A914REX4_PAREQ
MKPLCRVDGVTTPTDEESHPGHVRVLARSLNTTTAFRVTNGRSFLRGLCEDQWERGDYEFSVGSRSPAKI